VVIAWPQPRTCGLRPILVQAFCNSFAEFPPADVSGQGIDDDKLSLVAAMTKTPLLDGPGIVITPTHLAVPGRAFAWKSLRLVRVIRVGNVFTRLFSKERRKCHLMVSTKAEPSLVSIFESEDEALVKRVEEAINRVAEVLGAQRT
jgi:hypothetical protein